VKATKVQHEGKIVDADELEFRLPGTDRVAVELEDGTVLTIILTPVKIIRLRDIRNAEGEPVYQLKWGTGVSASVPGSLMQSVATEK
jgi:hypothetical protein